MSRRRLKDGYRELYSFQTAIIIYDATVGFCECFSDQCADQADRMLSTARSGLQTMRAGRSVSSVFSLAVRQLLMLACSNFENLRIEYQNFLQRSHSRQWEPNCPPAIAVRRVPRNFRTFSGAGDSLDITELSNGERWTLFAKWLEHDDPAIRANAQICLLQQVGNALEQQLAVLESRNAERTVSRDGRLSSQDF